MSVLEVLLFAVGLAAAGGLGWWLSRRRLAQQGPSDEQLLAAETLSRLQDLTSRVAAEVGEHASAVREISDQLHAGAAEHEVVAAVSRLITANQRMQQQLNSADERLQTQARQIESHAVEARTDALTQVANRRALDDELRRCLAEFNRRGKPATLLLIDVDHFKKFNDTHGHQAGDEILRGVARVLRQNVDGGLVARYGGEEFAVLFAGGPLSVARPTAERARAAIAAATFRFSGKELRVTASGGLAELLAGDAYETLLRRADEALYASKKGGRNCAHWNDGRTNHRVPPEAPRAPTRVGFSPSDAAWLKHAEEETEERFREAVSGVSTRAVFFDDLIRRLAHWRRGGAALSLLLMQVDNFPRILADYGPAAGATVLRVSAQVLKANMRDMDHLSRLGDDTFSLLLPGAALADTLAVAERVRQAIERCRMPKQAGVAWFTVSLGCVEAVDGDDMQRVLDRARHALEAALAQGRNCAFCHDGQRVVAAAACLPAAK